jgi:hypothetical protein
VVYQGGHLPGSESPSQETAWAAPMGQGAFMKVKDLIIIDRAMYAAARAFLNPYIDRVLV